MLSYPVSHNERGSATDGKCKNFLFLKKRQRTSDFEPLPQMTLAEVTKYITELCTESLLANKNAVYLVEGAFGTGKTMVLLNSILRLREEDRWNSKRIVICGASNASLDRIAGSIQLLHKNIGIISSLRCNGSQSADCVLRYSTIR